MNNLQFVVNNRNNNQIVHNLTEIINKINNFKYRRLLTFTLFILIVGLVWQPFYLGYYILLNWTNDQ